VTVRRPTGRYSGRGPRFTLGTTPLNGDNVSQTGIPLALTSAPVSRVAREELDRLTQPLDVGDGRLVDRLDDQARAIEDAANRYTLAIQLVQASDGDPALNCFRHALGLADLPEAFGSLIFDYGGALGIGSPFVEYLVREVFAATMLEDATPSDIAVYSRDGHITHAGIFDGLRVVSKWGGGHIWCHDVWAVPWSYGSEIHAFRPLGREQALAALTAFKEQEFGADVVQAILGLAG
jgi:hypothetical protein